MNLKQMVGIEAAKYVEDGMIVGLGTGLNSKIYGRRNWSSRKRRRIVNRRVTTSKETEKQALALGIPLKSIDEVPYVDLTIDGADEISADFQGIKGGAALLLKKLWPLIQRNVFGLWINQKMVDDLGLSRFQLRLFLMAAAN